LISKITGVIFSVDRVLFILEDKIFNPLELFVVTLFKIACERLGKLVDPPVLRSQIDVLVLLQVIVDVLGFVY